MGTIDRAFRNIWRKKARTLMVVALLSISLATMISVYSTIDASGDKTGDMIDDMESTLQDFQDQAESDLLLISIQAGGGRMFSQNTTTVITDSEMTDIESLDEVSDVYPVVSKVYGDMEDMFQNNPPPEFNGSRDPNFDPGDLDPSERPEGGFREWRDNMGDRDFSSWIDYTLQGVDLSGTEVQKSSLLPENIVSGRTLGGTDMYSALISEELTEFFDADLGDTIEIDNVTLNVVGIYSSDSNNNEVYTTISTAQYILGLEPGEYQRLNVYAANESVIDPLVAILQEYFPSYRVFSNAEMNARRVESMQVQTDIQVANLRSDMDDIESTGLMVILISMGTAGIVVLFIMLYTVRERTKEIGTLKAIGFTSKNVMSQFLAEGVLLALVGGVIGSLLGVIGAPFISEKLMPSSEITTSGSISLFVVVLGVLLMILLGSIGSLYPSWVASRKNPVEAMRHE